MSDERRDELLRFERLVRHHQADLLRYARLHVGDQHARDVVQDVWMAAWRGWAGERPDRLALLDLAGPPIQRHRRVMRRQRRQLQIDEVEAVAYAAAVDDQVVAREHAGAVRRTLAALGRRDQELLHLAAVHGLRHAEIAELLGMASANAASQAFSRARGRFRRAWAERRP
jgi:RNA polymerase sigma-70 factor (ECF subfamily)